MKMGGQFRSFVWDPLLIVSQIITMQSAYYVCLGFWILLVDFIVWRHRSLDQVFDCEELSFSEFHGRLLVTAFILNAFTGAIGLWFVIRRTKQCLDFTATVHVFHFFLCWAVSGTFPNTFSWWLANTISIIIMTVLGEFLCMRTEMKAIPLSMAAKVDL